MRGESHEESAVKLLKNPTEMKVLAAQVHATLALVEQQRIANEIALRSSRFPSTESGKNYHTGSSEEAMLNLFNKTGVKN